MVSRATKRFWKSVALGLALSPVPGVTSMASAQTTAPAPTAPASGMPAANLGGDIDTCRQLVRDGRAALQAGDKVKAEKLARQAAAMHVSMPFWETDTPEKLLLDIGVKNMPPPPAGAKKVDPHTLVKQGEEALKAGKIEDAQKLAQQAKMVPNVKWGLFEETPEKLLDEVQKARAERDKAESVKLLTQGRKLFEQGKYADAKKLAYKASSLHGPYGVWDFGDKPEKLLADIQSAEDKARKAKAPPAPSATQTAVAANKAATPAKPTTAPATSQNSLVKQTSANAPPPNWPTEVKTADVKGPDLGPGVVSAAVMPSAAVPSPVLPAGGPILPEPMGSPATPMAPAAQMPMPVAMAPMPVPQMPTPVAINPAPTPQMPTPVAMNPAPVPQMPTAVSMTPPPAPMPTQPKFDPAKMQAMQCIAEGKTHQAAGRYMEARGKYMEAQRCGAEFGPADETPDKCLMDLSSAVTMQIQTALRDASPAAEAKLNQARLLAVGFALDTRAIDTQLATMKGAATQAVHKAIAANDPRTVGQDILDKARLEIKRGQCEAARQLATHVYNGPYGLQDEAVVILRTIDVEEHNQRVLAANRNFDAGLAAYRSKEYAQASAIFQQVDPALLSPDKKAQLPDMLAKCSRPEAPALAQVPPPPPGSAIQPVSAPPGKPAGAVTTAAVGVTGLQGPMPKMTAPADGDSLAAQVQAMQDIEYQALRQEGLEVQRRALQMWERGETDAALETLDAYMKKVKASKLDPTSVARLQKPIEFKLSSFRLLKSETDANKRIVSAKDDFEKGKSAEMSALQKKQQQVKELMKEYQKQYKEGKYAEAELTAEKAHTLDPDDPTINGAIQIAQFHGNLATYDKIRDARAEFFKTGLDDAENEGPALNHQTPISFDPVRMKIANSRANTQNGINTLRTQSPKDLAIQAKLNKPVQVNFKNVPLSQAIEDLRAMTKMNIHLETQALAAEAINPESPVSLQADNISLKSALRVLLDQVHLTFVPADEMLKITTQRGARGKLVQKVYSVADLVIPIDDYIMPEVQNYNKMMSHIIEQQQINLNGSNTPMNNRMNMLPNGQPVGGGSNSMSTIPGGEASMRTNGVQPGSTGSSMSHIAAVAPTKQNLQDTLIKLITNSVAPDTWVDAAGSGTIEYMPIGMALVVNQTPDVQEQVADLLDALRRLQDLEVAVEVRIITLAETFFERIGLDFALNITPTKKTQSYEPQLVTGQFAPQGQINSFMPTNFLTGITGIGQQAGGVGSFTSDLDIPIRSSSFQYAIPPFAYPNNPGFDGGLSLGLAFLSDIQVYMFMEAAQGDRRTNVMQAPKLTLFNGQTSTINVNDQQFFVTNVNVVGFGGQIVFVPINNPVPLGVSLAIQAVVSADRRFVRLNLAPTLTNLASATVPLFPVTTFITPVFEGGAQGQPIPFTQFIQQPNVASVQIQTTVSIPDGGTVILGGLKTLSEGRNEFGPPVLSKLPYIDRLFKNVGYGREAQSLLLMVTPRIIINSEEEEKQTGEVSRSTVAQP